MADTIADTYAHALCLLDLLERDFKRLHDNAAEPVTGVIQDCAEHRLQIVNKLRFAANLPVTTT